MSVICFWRVRLFELLAERGADGEGRVRLRQGTELPLVLEALAVGSGGAIYKSTDHGATFTVRTSGVVGQLEDVAHVTGTTIWYAVGAQGTVLKSTDDGETWVTLVSNVAEATLSGVCTGSNTNRVWAAGSSGHLIFSASGGL